MKMIFIMVLATALQVSARTIAQNITLSVKNASLEQVFNEIKKQSGYGFFFDYSLMDQSKKVTLSVKEMPIDEVLPLCFKDQPFTYEVVNKNIFVKLKPVVQNKPELKKPLAEGPPPIDVHGRIVNENGEPVVASVTVKGTGLGTTSNTKGEFQLTGINENATLVVTATNIEQVEMKVNGKTELLIHVSMSVNALNDIVVVGYGSQKKSDLTGSVSRIKGDDLKLLPTQRVDQALQGRAAGVMVINTDGAPGGNTVIRIRGTNSINGDNSALIVVDGLQGGNLNSLNPNDIASIEVLKDASATAIYGSQGANGVILITTKLGKIGKPVINYVNDFSASTLNNKPDLLNAADFARETNKVRLAVNGNGMTPQPIFSDDEIQGFAKNGGTDWIKEVYRTSITQNNQLSVSGASDRISYLLSGAYLNQQGILKNSAYKRYTVRANVKGEITKWASFGINLAWSKENANSALFGGQTSYPGNPIAGAIRFSPTIPVFDDSVGNYSRAALRYANPTLWNPLASTLEPIINNGTIRNNINAFLEFKILDGLTLKVSGGSATININRYNFYNNKTFTGLSLNGSGGVYSDNNTYFQNSNILTYDKTVRKHHFTITAVGEQKFTKDFNSTVLASDFSDEKTGVFDLGGAGVVTSASNYSERVINSYLGRVNYIFDNKYLLTASMRADGSSVFGSENKWGYFPSGSVAWRAAEEPFIRDLNIFSDLKFRISYGITGNQAINPYQTLAHVSSGYSYPYFGTDVTDLGFSVTSTANPHLKWEKTAQTDIGVDFSVWKGRLNFTVDYYNKKTTDLLMPRDLVTYSGLSSVIDNVGSIRNEGFEFSISGDPFTGRFSWSTGINLTANRATVLDLGEVDRIGFVSGGSGGQGVGSAFMYLVKGQPYGEMLGYQYNGVWKEKEAQEAAAFGQLPGDPRYEDVNGDGIINSKDEKVIGNSTPKFIFGWTNRMAYRNFDLTFLVQGSQGNDIFNISRIALESPGGTGAALLNRWSPENQDSPIPAIIDQQTRNNAGLASKVKIPGSAANRTSRWVEDGSYVRLKNITVGYNLPVTVANRIHLSNLRVYASATNLLTITNYTGNDPEVSSYTGNDAQMGSDFNNYPQSRILSLGLNVSF